MLDRKIELNSLTEDAFEKLLLEVNGEVLQIAKEAQDKINSILFNRIGIKCDITLNYSIEV